MGFHVPELARDTARSVLGTTSADGNNGVFHVDSPEPGWTLALIASDGDGWEHVSVHAYRKRTVDGVGLLGRAESTPRMRTPTWKEMAYVKRLCWEAEDVVMQLHPRESEYGNCHQHVLHLWRPTNAEIPTPPPEFVGPMSTDRQEGHE